MHPRRCRVDRCGERRKPIESPAGEARPRGRWAAFIAPALALLLLALACRQDAPPRVQGTLPPGDHEFSLQHARRTRRYRLHVPPQAKGGEPLPVVIQLHGGGGHAAGHQRYVQMDRLADQEGFLVLYPQGTGRFEGRLLTWNAGACCGYALEEDVDDVDFVLTALEDLTKRTPIDRDRVYATGLSNGAMMAYRLAVEASERITAIAPVAGGMVVDSFAPTRPVPVMHIHSADDPRAPYAGGLGPPHPLTHERVHHPSIEETLAQWTDNNGCPATPSMGPIVEGEPGSEDQGHTAVKHTYAPCQEGSSVVHWKLTGAGHVWPGGERDYLEVILGPSTTIMDANKEMWGFFSRFDLERP